MQQYGMVKGKVAYPKYLFHIATQTENRYTLIERSAHLALLKNGINFTNTIQLYN